MDAGGEREEDDARLDCCWTSRLPAPVDPGRAVFPIVHRTGAIGAAAMTGHAVNEMIRRRTEAAGFTPAQTQLLGAH